MLPDIAPTPKRTRIDPALNGLALSSPASPQLDPDSDVYILSSPPRVMMVIYNNLNAERKYKKILETCVLEKKQSIGLIKPNGKLPSTEYLAYDAILSKDELDIAWILKQPVNKKPDFFTISKLLYATATRMLKKAHALGSPTVQYYAASFLQSWRSSGTPFSIHPAPLRSPISWSLLLPRLLSSGRVRCTLPWLHGESASPSSSVDMTFYRAWDMVTLYEKQLAAVHI
jgi:hypothetical protein